jgi:uncharacterized protein (TIGR03086 family)
MTRFDLGPGVERLSELVARVTEDELTKPTPCPAYTVGDLIDHIGGCALGFTAAAEKDTQRYGDQGPSGDASRLTDDWRARIPRDLGTLAAAWRKPDAWEGMTRIAGMDAPGEMVALTAADEIVVHGWDLARATGQPYDAEPELVEAAGNFLGYFASPDAPAGDDVAFGPSRPAPERASPLERVLALAGRDPGWSPPR